ncbi:MAG: anti-sigma factor family protein [Terriglobales bacterium]
MTITCPQFTDWISGFLDGELSTENVVAMRDHSAGCPRCATVLSNLQQTIGLTAASRAWPLPDGASERLHLRLEQDLDEPLAPAPLRPAQALPPRQVHAGWRRMRFTGLAAAIVLVTLAVGVVRWRAGASTLSGWLIDQNCLASFQGHAQDHTRDCLLKCQRHVMGLVDAQGHFRPFDAQGDLTAMAAVRSSQQRDHLWVTVRARHSVSNTLDVEQLELAPPGQDSLAK